MSGLLGRNVLVIEQKPKFVELTNEYRVMDETGNEIGVIRQEGQSKARKLLRLVGSIDQFLTHRLSMYDAVGAKVLDIVRPAKFLPVSARSAASRSDGQASCGKASRRPIGISFTSQPRFRRICDSSCSPPPPGSTLR